MPPLTLRRKITALALAAALAVPWTAAAAPLARQQTAGPGVLQQLWSVLTGFWDIGVTPDDGCRMDPDGRCATGATTSSAATLTLDDGCRMDPSGGGCAAGRAGAEPLITPDDGCTMDPSGGCRPGG
jgi:transposase